MSSKPDCLGIRFGWFGDLAEFLARCMASIMSICRGRSLCRLRAVSQRLRHRNGSWHCGCYGCTRSIVCIYCILPSTVPTIAAMSIVHLIRRQQARNRNEGKETKPKRDLRNSVLCVDRRKAWGEVRRLEIGLGNMNWS